MKRAAESGAGLAQFWTHGPRRPPLPPKGGGTGTPGRVGECSGRGPAGASRGAALWLASLRDSGGGLAGGSRVETFRGPGGP